MLAIALYNVGNVKMAVLTHRIWWRQLGLSPSRRAIAAGVPLKILAPHGYGFSLGALVSWVIDFIQKCVTLAGLDHFGIINPGLRFAYPGLSYSGLQPTGTEWPTKRGRRI